MRAYFSNYRPCVEVWLYAHGTAVANPYARAPHTPTPMARGQNARRRNAGIRNRRPSVSRSSSQYPDAGDNIEVCYLDKDNDEKWYAATVSACIPVVSSGAVIAAGVIVFRRTPEEPESNCTVNFVDGGMLFELNGCVRKRGTSMWRPTSAPDALSPSQATASAASASLGVWDDAGHQVDDEEYSRRRAHRPRRTRSPGRAVSPRRTRSPQRAHSPPDDTEQSGRDGPCDDLVQMLLHNEPLQDALLQFVSRMKGVTPRTLYDKYEPSTASMQLRTATLEAQVQLLMVRNPTEFMTAILNEMRVETKARIMDELSRQPRRTTSRPTDAPCKSQWNMSQISFTYPCSMQRFKLFLDYIHDRFCGRDNSDERAAVRFFPDFKNLSDTIGFAEASVSFATANDLFDYLNMSIDCDRDKLVSYAYDTDNDGTEDHIRVLGGTQTLHEESGQRVRVYTGSSCSIVPVRAAQGCETETPANFISMDTSGWDSENNCPLSPLTVGSEKSGFSVAGKEALSAFTIRWVTEKPKVQRRFSHVSVDREGVRRGTMHVVLPCVTAGPYLFREFTSCSAFDTHSPATT